MGGIKAMGIIAFLLILIIWVISAICFLFAIFTNNFEMATNSIMGINGCFIILFAISSFALGRN